MDTTVSALIVVFNRHDFIAAEAFEGPQSRKFSNPERGKPDRLATEWAGQNPCRFFLRCHARQLSQSGSCDSLDRPRQIPADPSSFDAAALARYFGPGPRM
jgi:hypothetical protein